MRIDLGNDYSLRRYLYGDVIALAKHGDNPNVAAYMRGTFPQPYTVEYARAWIRHVKENEVESRFVIDYQGECIGDIGFVVLTDIHCHTAEIGFWMSEDHWGKGVMSAAVNAVCDYIFTTRNVVRINAEVQSVNYGSRRVLEKCGFELEATLKKHIYKHNQFCDQWVFARFCDNNPS